MKKYILPLIVCGVMGVLNCIARLSTSFADFYAENIFRFISVPFAFFSGIFPFSLGEFLIVAGLVLVAVGVPLTVILLIFGKNYRKKTISVFAVSILWIFTFVLSAETLNCFIMYQCTPFSEKYLNSTEHKRSELISLYSALIEKTNLLSESVSRDGDGRFVFMGDIQTEARSAMKSIGEDYPQLSGYYPRAKPIQFSYFMSQSHLLGIYFPFSMEANYNNDMVNTNLPDTVCHEYSHLKGFMQEDEANFIAFLATTHYSESTEMQYSGYLSALEYVHNQIYEKNITEAYYLTDKVSDNVKRDWFRFLPDTYWEDNKEKEVIPTEKVSSASTTAMDTNIKMNGRQDGVESYSQMVNLLLDYYF